jgi:hypothetical protein
MTLMKPNWFYFFDRVIRNNDFKFTISRALPNLIAWKINLRIPFFHLSSFFILLVRTHLYWFLIGNWITIWLWNVYAFITSELIFWLLDQNIALIVTKIVISFENLTHTFFWFSQEIIMIFCIFKLMIILFIFPKNYWFLLRFDWGIYMWV